MPGRSQTNEGKSVDAEISQVDFLISRLTCSVFWIIIAISTVVLIDLSVDRYWMLELVFPLFLPLDFTESSRALDRFIILLEHLQTLATWSDNILLPSKIFQAQIVAAFACLRAFIDALLEPFLSIQCSERPYIHYI